MPFCFWPFWCWGSDIVCRPSWCAPPISDMRNDSWVKVPLCSLELTFLYDIGVVMILQHLDKIEFDKIRNLSRKKKISGNTVCRIILRYKCESNWGRHKCEETKQVGTSPMKAQKYRKQHFESIPSYTAVCSVDNIQASPSHRRGFGLSCLWMLTTTWQMKT